MGVGGGGGFEQAQREALVEQLRHAPTVADVPAEGAPLPVTASRWNLARMQAQVSWLHDYSLSGIWRLLQREQLTLRQGRPQLYSPDPDYLAKEARLLAVLRQVAQEPTRYVLLFVDEFTYRNWPVPGRCWTACEGPPPQALRAPPGERTRRIVGGVAALTGQVVYRQAQSITQETFIAFLRQVNRTFAQAEHIYLVVDNWAPHFGQKVQPVLAQQLTRLELVRLPTYAPWLNPIEKLWGWLKQDLLKMHAHADDWPAVQRQVTAFLDYFVHGSTVLLHRIGLTGTGKLAQALIADLDTQN